MAHREKYSMKKTLYDSDIVILVTIGNSYIKNQLYQLHQELQQELQLQQELVTLVTIGIVIYMQFLPPAKR